MIDEVFIDDHLPTCNLGAHASESGIGPIESIFNRGPVAMAGGATQVNRASWDMEEPYNVIHITSQRSVYDMGELTASLFIHPTGQSGHPTNRHYDDYIEPYRKGEYHPNLWDRQAVEKFSPRHLLLKPSGSD